MKLPAFQFYPGDWKKDPGVQALSFHDRGVWFEILCLMHESEERGKLVLNGSRMPEDALARLLGLDKQILTNTITTLLTYGVASVEPDTNILFCRRMVRDENLRKIRTEAGKKGGNPRLLKQNQTSPDNQNQTTGDNQISTPSSSSSSSSSDSTPLPPQGDVQAGEKDRCLPSGWRKLSKDDKKKSRVLQNTPMMVEIGSWFGRMPTTLWTISEAESLLKINPTPNDIEGMGFYYRGAKAVPDNHLRHSVDTLLNNWSGELDRARNFYNRQTA